MKHIPTDLEILNAIYNNYYDKFIQFSENEKDRSSKAFVPIDIVLIAKEFDVDADVIFGRLYYHLNFKYGYSNDEGKSKVLLFNALTNSIHFPYLSSILADLRNEDKKYLRAITFSVISATVSIISLTLSLITFLKK